MFRRHVHQADLSAYQDGELSPGAAKRVADHLRQCPSCLAQVREIAQTASVLRSMAVPRPPADLAVKIAQHIEGERMLIRPRVGSRTSRLLHFPARSTEPSTDDVTAHRRLRRGAAVGTAVGAAILLAGIWTAGYRLQERNTLMATEPSYVEFYVREHNRYELTRNNGLDATAAARFGR